MWAFLEHVKLVGKSSRGPKVDQMVYKNDGDPERG